MGQVRIQHLIPDDPFVGSPFYAADFVLIPDAEELCGFKQALLIEINPPPPVAGTVLFDWKSDRDRAILMGESDTGTGSPCLRLAERQMSWAKVDFHPPAKGFVDMLRGRQPSSYCTWLFCCRRR